MDVGQGNFIPWLVAAISIELSKTNSGMQPMLRVLELDRSSPISDVVSVIVAQIARSGSVRV